ncbi:O-antigen ligase family protein [Qipengyuania sp. CAU 1752]
MTTGVGDARNANTDHLFAAVAFQMAVALLLGGTARPANVLVCFLASLPTLYLLLAGVRGRKLGWFARIALALYGLSWLQLVPLPPSVWTALAGRGLAAQVLDVVGLPLGWRPLALDPGAALGALVAIVAPLVMLVAFARLTWPEQLRLLQGVVALALIAAFLGLIQRVTGGLAPYGTEHAGYATGVFANRNHHAVFLACALVLLPTLVGEASKARGRLLGIGAAAILLAGLLATTSRAGIALGALAMVVVFAMSVRLGARSILAGGAVVVLAVVALSQAPALESVFARFAMLGEDQRIIMLETSWAATRAFFPWGSGWGSFVPVYMAFEDLDTMAARYVVAAHNDYVQLALEGGLLGLVIAWAAPGALLLLVLRRWGHKAAPGAWSLWWVAGLLLLHSAVDYPLRTTALATVLALAFAAQEIHRKALPEQGTTD